MSARREAQPNYRIFRRQRFDLARNPPDFVDEKIPTAPIRIGNFGHGTATLGVGSAWLLGSRRLVGSPNDITYQLLYRETITNTPNVFFALTHSRGSPKAFAGPFPGTELVWLLESRGAEIVLGRPDQPIAAFPPGTLRLYALGPGSNKTSGKGSPPNIQGLGSPGRLAVGAFLKLYPV